MDEKRFIRLGREKRAKNEQMLVVVDKHGVNHLAHLQRHLQRYGDHRTVQQEEPHRNHEELGDVRLIDMIVDVPFVDADHVAHASRTEQSDQNELEAENENSEPIDHAIGVCQFHFGRFFVHSELRFVSGIDTGCEAGSEIKRPSAHVFGVAHVTDLQKERFRREGR